VAKFKGSLDELKSDVSRPIMNCPFCQCSHSILAETKLSFAVLDNFPVSKAARKCSDGIEAPKTEGSHYD
jgi:hypothetical protein